MIEAALTEAVEVEEALLPRGSGDLASGLPADTSKTLTVLRFSTECVDDTTDDAGAFALKCGYSSPTLLMQSNVIVYDYCMLALYMTIACSSATFR